MDTNIKYLIEKIVNFNPAEYTDNDTIDIETINDITDPVNTFISFLKKYDWKKFKGLDTSGIHIIKQNLIDVWYDIYKQIFKLTDQFGDTVMNTPVDSKAYIWETDLYNNHGLRGKALYIVDTEWETKNITFAYIHNDFAPFIKDEIIISVYDIEHIHDILNNDKALNRGMVYGKLIDKTIKNFNLL